MIIRGLQPDNVKIQHDPTKLNEQLMQPKEFADRFIRPDHSDIHG
jgi:hypothetical protein